MVDPTHTEPPVRLGSACTVTVAVAWQPLLFVYVMIVVPAIKPVTTPPLLTVATLVFDEEYGVVPFGVPEPVNVIVDPTHTEPPVRLGSAGAVIVADVVATQPASSVTVTV